MTAPPGAANFAPASRGIDDTVIQVARTNRNPVVQMQALFWLGPSKDPRALGYIEEILTR